MWVVTGKFSVGPGVHSAAGHPGRPAWIPGPDQRRASGTPVMMPVGRSRSVILDSLNPESRRVLLDLKP